MRVVFFSSSFIFNRYCQYQSTTTNRRLNLWLERVESPGSRRIAVLQGRAESRCLRRYLEKTKGASWGPDNMLLETVESPESRHTTVVLLGCVEPRYPRRVGFIDTANTHRNKEWGLSKLQTYIHTDTYVHFIHIYAIYTLYVWCFPDMPIGSSVARILFFPVQLTTSRIGNPTRLIHTLLYVMTIYICCW